MIHRSLTKTLQSPLASVARRSAIKQNFFCLSLSLDIKRGSEIFTCLVQNTTSSSFRMNTNETIVP
jgi:hypothetical protein